MKEAIKNFLISEGLNDQEAEVSADNILAGHKWEVFDIFRHTYNDDYASIVMKAGK